MKIETEASLGEESDVSDSETNGELELSKVTEMRIIPSDPGQCILLANCLIKILVFKKWLPMMLLYLI
jgi:hypothetical protein